MTQFVDEVRHRQQQVQNEAQVVQLLAYAHYQLERVDSSHLSQHIMQARCTTAK